MTIAAFASAMRSGVRALALLVAPRRRFVAALLFSCAVAASACDRQPARGAAGESCTSRDDCESGLHCVAQMCVDGKSASPSQDAGSAPGAVGADCASRRDCETGLVCVANECVPASDGMLLGRYSGRGESCSASNECDPSLACVNGTCMAVSVTLEHTPKSCHRMECAADEDCCADFIPNVNCPAYQENCATDPVFCNTYRSLCECNKSCDQELCVASVPGCSDNAECTSQQTPFCVEGSCRQCESDGNCPGDGAQCVEGVCMSGCTADEQCPQLHACQDSACVEVGCRSDRECVFLTKDPNAACRDGECSVPCDADSDCATQSEPFHVCIDAQCVFVGCEADYECRALFGIESQQSTARAICR